MRFFNQFIVRPVATSLLCLAMVVAGSLALVFLPVSPLPQIDFPVISVSASIPGASPETMASSVATPLEQSLGAIAGISEMSSRSREGNTRISLIFDLDRDVNSAARDVQAAINAARAMLPSSLRNPPTYHKFNPSSAPVMILALTSETATQGQLYDLADTVLAQKLSQVVGVGEVEVGGSSLPAVRVSLNPHALNAAGIALDDVRAALSNANTMRPNGVVENDRYNWQLNAGGQLTRAADYRPLIVAWRNGAAVRLRDVARVEDSVENEFNVGFFNDREAVLLLVRRQANANIIETVDAIRAQLPAFQAMLPAHVNLTVAQDRSPSIRASLHEAEITLLIAVALVVMVVLIFLRNLRAALIPAIAVPASLVTTFSFMLWFGFTLNTVSLTALIVATGFVVDDAIVVLENIMRHIERGASPMRAAMRGVREVGFTVLAMSLSLIAVFIPMLLMGGMMGRMFKEFAVTLSVSVLVSLLISVTVTPMMSARLLRGKRDGAGEPAPAKYRRTRARLMASTAGRGLNACWRAVRGLAWAIGGAFHKLGNVFWRGYRRSLRWALLHGRLMMLVLAATVGLNLYLYAVVPKGFLPQQDTGQLLGFFRVDQGTSFHAMKPKLDHFRDLLLQDPAVESVAGFAGGRGGSNSSFLMIQLKPLTERDASAMDVVNRMRLKFSGVPGARLTLVPQQDIFVGGRQGGSATYDYSILGGDLAVIKAWLPRVQRAMAGLPELVDVDTNVEDKGQRIELVIDRDAATRLGVDMSLIASTLNNSFSMRQVSVIYGALNQYHVVMGVDAPYAQDVASLKRVEVVTSDGNRIPLSAFTRFEMGSAPLSVEHEGLLAAESVSFSLAPGVTLDQATRAIDQAMARIGLPSDQLQAGLLGSGREMLRSMGQMPMLILAALVTMYIVLGILYESYVHPVTILSTLPSAGVGALMALLLVGEPFTLIALIGVFLLIGIVKKNAIMMVDFALLAERKQGLSSREAIYQACLVRFRPIMMTTISAMLGALPLVLASGAGVEMRRPLGLTIVGGLLISQILTLYTTPVVYLYLDRFRLWARRRQTGHMTAGEQAGTS
ncbi:multidrug transporter subunit MdtC [Allopusillimonas soli]|uniref:Efflux RND transporter permease subunit n=1 Tax=Allopusillimonas soli TaxID=659016 RepID=A0A853FDA0_9BURK|nr:efflux RND transporter permease subunit [Allopusillimonas soli]NYT37622.1 efflux RND transporter permease subunit [Allopusillimonas soli]TEA74415.1 multidrug transporter subunit MdtC [Allopusillimonas soli]